MSNTAIGRAERGLNMRKNVGGIWWHFILITVFCSGTCASESKLRSELHLGLGIGGQYLPHYRGSTETNTTVLPIPVIEYKGKILKSDRDGTRVEFSLAERVEFNISADLALRNDVEDNRLREGMPELQSEFQLGPSINIDLTGHGFHRGLILRLPVRPALAVGSDVDYIGYTANPMLTWVKPQIVNNWRLTLDLGVLYGSRDYHEHYYNVERKYVTPLRPYYAAKDGFSGTFTELGISSRSDDVIYGFSLRYDNLRGTAFYSSPLVETDHYWSVSFGIGWLFKSWIWTEPL
jgi:MipA family protein